MLLNWLRLSCTKPTTSCSLIKALELHLRVEFTRYENGDKDVIDKMNRIAVLAEEGKHALLDRDVSKLHNLMNENFDLRSKIMHISESNYELVETARKCGASSKFAGSGGSIIGIYEDDKMLTRLIVELKKIQARVIKPYIV